MYSFNLKKRGNEVLLLGSLWVALVVMPASVWAACLVTTESNYCLVVDASSTCEDLSANMHGCETDSSGECVIINPDRIDPNFPDPANPDIVVQLTSGAVGSVPTEPDLVSWTVTQGPLELSGKEVDLAIVLGATGGGTSSWNYWPGGTTDSGLAFEKNNGSYQKVNGIFFCSNFEAPPPNAAQLTLKKTVMLDGGTCGSDDVENLSLKVGMKVQYCFEIQNVGIGEAGNVTLNDPIVEIVDQQVGDGSLDPSQKVVITSGTVTIDTEGETVNSAMVTGISSEIPSTPQVDAEDTATVNAELALELCPPDYQGAVDAITTGQGEDGFKYAVLLDPKNPDRLSICVPGENSGDAATVVECVNQCILKPECKDDPTISDCDFAYGNTKCEASGNWTTAASVGSECSVVPYVPDGVNFPNCWETIHDQDRNCVYEEVETLQGIEIDVQVIHSNPFCYLSCANVADLTTCQQICF